jgi:protein-tyrosine phosphatase
MALVGVLFVCTGNICRSPTAEGVFRGLVRDAGLDQAVWTDSAGTQGWHVGEPPDSRAQSAAARRGFDLADLRARRVRIEDFTDFDYLVAMDSGHQETLLAMAPPKVEERAEEKVRMMLSFAPHLGVRDVPDPYYGAAGGFEEVLDMIEAASDGLLAHIRQTHNL